MENIKLKYIDINEFKNDMYNYYLDIFPEVERKSLDLIQLAYERRVHKDYKNPI